MNSVLLQLFSDQHKIDRSSTFFLEQHKFYNGGFSSHKIQLFSDEHKTDRGSTLFKFDSGGFGGLKRTGVSRAMLLFVWGFGGLTLQFERVA